MKCYWMLQNSRVTAFTVFELSRENQKGEGKITPLPSPGRTQIKVVGKMKTIILKYFRKIYS